MLAAKKYLEAFNVAEFDDDAAEEIAVQSNGIPYYIRSISLSCNQIDRRLTKSHVEAIVNDKIRETTDALHIDEDHFQRLKTADYYDESKYDAIYDLMSILSHRANGMPMEIALEELNVTLKQNSKAKWTQSDFDTLVKSLAADHLIERVGANIKFKYEIVRRSWNFHNAGGE
jgi:hypothetical protein